VAFFSDGSGCAADFLTGFLPGVDFDDVLVVALVDDVAFARPVPVDSCVT
jgi:hypothetical protein